MKKSCPNPTNPKELLLHYFHQFHKWIIVSYRDCWRDPFGKKRQIKFKELLKFKNSGEGKVCFVFANGPSTAKLDFNKIKDFRKKEKA